MLSHAPCQLHGAPETSQLFICVTMAFVLVFPLKSALASERVVTLATVGMSTFVCPETPEQLNQVVLDAGFPRIKK